MYKVEVGTGHRPAPADVGVVVEFEKQDKKIGFEMKGLYPDGRGFVTGR